MDRFGDVPSHAAERRVIVALDNSDFADLELNDRDGRFSNKQVAIVNADEVRNSTRPDVARLVRQGLLEPNAVLVQSPFRNQNYLRIQESEHALAVEKFLAISNVCGMLGASRLEVREVETTTQRRSLGGALKAGAKGITPEVRAKSETAEEFKRELSLLDSFVGGQSDPDAASQFLVDLNLDGDYQMRSLIDGRSFAGNRLGSRELVVDLSREATRLFDLAASIDLPETFAAGLTIQRTVASTASYWLKMNVQFA